jgi:hypothetical protein
MESSMSEPASRATADEHVVALLRTLPVEQLRELMAALDEMVGPPACAEAQADGVPCLSAANDCARCLLTRTALAAVARRLEIA